jgi:hypothetical protein
MDKVGEWLVLMAYASIIFVLVRPKSQGPKLVTAIGNSVTSLTKAATGGGHW